MTVFDLLFLAVFFTAVGMLLAAGFALIRRRALVVTRLRRLGILVGGYLGIVILVSLASPRRVLKMGDPICWDDWCFAVTNVQREAAEQSESYTVTLRVFSRARRVAQRERGVHVYLMDDQRRCYEPMPDNGAIPFDVRLQPQESVVTTRRFELPADARDSRSRRVT